MKAHFPHVFWLFGLSGAGKSTLARLLAQKLRALNGGVLALDGDDLRRGLNRGLGFTDQDRAENLRRAAETAKLGLHSNLNVVASFITPLESHRALVAGILRPRLSLIHIHAPLEICRQRDVKGLYLSAQTGHTQLMTGITSGFEPPTQADLTIMTAEQDIEASGAILLAFAQRRLSQPPASDAS